MFTPKTITKTCEGHHPLPNTETLFRRSSAILRRTGLLALLSMLNLIPAARVNAGFTLEMDVIRYHQYGYYFSPNLMTNNSAPAVPFGNYCVSSYGYPTNGSYTLYQFDTNGFNQINGGTYGYGDYDRMVHELTNGVWYVYATNSVTTNVYEFHVTVNTTSNDFPYVDITYPPDGATDVAAEPTFTWQGGPTNYNDLIVYQGPNSAYLPITQTNWVGPPMLEGINTFTPHYDSNSTTAVISSVPTNSALQPISSWVSTAHLQDYSQSQFTVGFADTSGTAHTLVAHYPFDATSGAVLDAAQDVSGNGYDMSFGGGYGAEGGIELTSDAAAGIGALLFHDGDGSSGGYLGWAEPTPPALLSALAGDFSVSCWIKTTQNMGWNTAPAYYGAGVVTADDSSLDNDVIPIALTGGAVAFNTGGTEDDTLNSQATVNDGNYHHIVVTRNQETGQKIIYIDGVMDSFSSGTTNLLNDPQKLTIGALADASDPDPNDFSCYNGYDGELDDLQIYSGALSADDVANLYANPGSEIPNGGGTQDFNDALGTSGLDWSTSGDTTWFVEANNTYNGAPSAAQSGAVMDSQSSTLSVTVTGPGTVTFYWSSQASGNFDYEFDIDGNYQDDISGDYSWYQDGPFTIPAGQHTLSWTTYAYGDEDPTEAGFLDGVSFIAETLPVITLSPFSQTNYPGYPVWLDAAVATNSSISWQWYMVGSGPISGATQPNYIPSNSGTPGVAGSYYAIASNDAGSAVTATAVVTFATAPAPPGWSAAFKSPFEAQDDSQVTRDYYYGCTTDTNGNIYTAAEFGGNMQVGSMDLDSGSGGDAAAIVKQTPGGLGLWAVGITNNGVGSAYALTVAPAPGGGVYLAGNYANNNWLGTNLLADNGNGNVFLARFDANGSNLWIQTFGGTNVDFTIINSLASDAAGNVTLSALLGNGPVTIGSSNYVVNGQEGVLIQSDPSGAVRWSELLPNEWAEYLTYGSGQLYVSVNTVVSGGTTNITVGGVTNVTDRSWAVACLNDTNGQPIWVRGVGAQYGSGNGNPYATGLIDDVPRLAVSGTNLLMTGVAYSSDASFGPITVSFGDLRGEYFARYDTAGNPITATTYGSVTTTPNAAVADSRGDLYVSGVFDNYASFGNVLIAAPEATRLEVGDFSQAFVAKFDINGNPLWADEAVSTVTVNFLGITLATNGVWASGWCQSGYYPQPEYTQFGSHDVYSDGQFVYGGAGGSTSIIWYPAGVLANVTDTTATAAPVILINPADNGVNFQFQFLSESGFSHNILYRTNLLAGSWQTNSTVSGDGTLKTVSVPLSLFAPSKQGFIRVSTQ